MNITELTSHFNVTTLLSIPHIDEIAQGMRLVESLDK